MNINERLKLLRESLELSQAAFGNKLSLERSAISLMERGQRSITERTIIDICRQFNVNEQWLKSGVEPMHNETFTSFIDDVIQEYDLDTLDRQIIESYARLDDNKKTAIKSFILDLAKSFEHEQGTELAPEPQNQTDARIEKELEAYRQELLAEAKGETLSVSESTKMHAKSV